MAARGSPISELKMGGGILAVDFAPSANTQACSGPRGLAADGPSEDRADKLMLFGQFVGDWDVDFTVYGADGTRQTEKAEWHFGWVLEGRAVQDVWIVP